MRLATADESRALDRCAAREYGISGALLMEAAGARAAHAIYQSYYPELQKGFILILCGPGNNGADGLVVARHLHSFGHVRVRILCIQKLGGLEPSDLFQEEPSVLFQEQYERIQKIGISTHSLTPQTLKQFSTSIQRAGIIVDALFGVGLNRELSLFYQDVIACVNTSSAPVISLDIPSGINAETGQHFGNYIHADQTLTFGLSKPGLYLEEGPRASGHVRVLLIGYPRALIRAHSKSYALFTDKQARQLLPARAMNSHKYKNGKLLVIAGHEGQWGAGFLTAWSAYRAGCGHVTWASFDLPQGTIPEGPEILTAQVAKLPSLSRFDALVIGPGLGLSAISEELLKRVLNECRDTPVLLDADALSALAKMRPIKKLPDTWCLTPHAGEVSRLLGVPSHSIADDRGRAAREVCAKLGGTVLVKGFRTLVCSSTENSRVWIVGSGNHGLAKAGTGDALAGIIGTFLAQGCAARDAALLGAYIHGRTADLWKSQGQSARAFMATDISKLLTQVFQEIENAEAI